MKKQELTTEQVEKLKQLYPDHTNKEMAQLFGCTEWTVRRTVAEIGLSKVGKTAEFRKRMSDKANEVFMANGRKNNWKLQRGLMQKLRDAGKCTHTFKSGENNLQRLGEEREALRLQRIGKARRSLLEAERRRINWGLPQKTKLKICFDQRRMLRKAEWRCNLRKRGYIVAYASNIIYYDDNTKRSQQTEQTIAKYGFVVLPVGKVEKKEFIPRSFGAGETYTGFYNFK